MDNEIIKSIKLEKHDTKDIIDSHVNGSLTVIWRDWDTFMLNSPKMIYVSSVNPNEIKGPHLHLRRNSYFTCIHGEVVFVVRNENGTYDEFFSSPKEPNIICVPKNIQSAHLNLFDDISRVLTLADISWKPNDNEMKNTTFDDYDWSKWKK